MLVLLLYVAVLPLIIVGTVSIRRGVDAVGRTAEQNLQVIASTAGALLDENLSKSQRLQAVVATSETVVNACSALLAERKDLLPGAERWLKEILSCDPDLEGDNVISDLAMVIDHNGIINDILDFSKIEAGKMQMESVDLSLDEVLDNISTVVGVKTHEKELEFLMDTSKDAPLALVGDSLRLGQALINQCNNAIKFTQEGEIVIATKVVEKDEKSVTLQFCVRDTGVGLTISKRLVNMMGGEIWVESEPSGPANS